MCGHMCPDGAFGGGYATPIGVAKPHRYPSTRAALLVLRLAKNSLHRFGVKAPNLDARDIVFMRETVRFLSVLTFK